MTVAGKDISREMTRACAVCAIKPKKSLVMDWMWKLPKRRCPVGLPCSGAADTRFFPVGEKKYPVLQTNGVRRQNGFINVGWWRKEPLAKKNRTRLFVCGKTHLKNISPNVYYANRARNRTNSHLINQLIIYTH
jgi:hypothetical protein